jgi:hypothetical protein
MKNDSIHCTGRTQPVAGSKQMTGLNATFVRISTLLAFICFLGCAAVDSSQHRESLFVSGDPPNFQKVENPGDLFPPVKPGGGSARLKIDSSRLSSDSPIRIIVLGRYYTFDNIKPNEYWFTMPPDQYMLRILKEAGKTDSWEQSELIGFYALNRQEIEVVLKKDRSTGDWLGFELKTRGVFSKKLAQAFNDGSFLETDNSQFIDTIAAPLRSAVKFIDLLDRERFEESWETADIKIPTKIKRKWVNLLKSTRTPLGSVESRRLKSNAYRRKKNHWTRRLNFGSPNPEAIAETADFGFVTNFSGSGGVKEYVRVRWNVDELQWRVDAYRLEKS